jgi:hypothetical protein
LSNPGVKRRNPVGDRAILPHGARWAPFPSAIVIPLQRWIATGKTLLLTETAISVDS